MKVTRRIHAFVIQTLMFLLRFSDFRSFRAVFLFCAVGEALFTLLYFGTLHTLVRDSCILYTT
jgi:hypothetical protein